MSSQRLSSTILLPRADRSLVPFTVPDTVSLPPNDPALWPRVAYAAAHVVADPVGTATPWSSAAGVAAVDWDATLAYRRHLWSLGFKIAEAMDTSQRGMGLDCPTARELIGRSLAEARTIPGADLACGAGTDHLDPADARTVDDVIRAYEEQVGAVEGLGGRVILMASRALARVARGPDDYIRVYDRILSQTANKVVLHWLGAMFDPALAGYWGGADFKAALPTVLAIIEAHRGKVEGIKISLLDARYEIALRRRLPHGVLMFTGDDFNYPELIAGDEAGASHALLGIFDAIAPVAASALTALGRGDRAGFDRLLAPTVPLSRTIFEAPTQFYKAGVVFLAWLNGHQDHFAMIGGMQSARGIVHYAEVFRLAAEAGLLADPVRATSRMRGLLSIHGVA
ncbi:dihydrodipicolinate synthase family protein [Methyloraptor flagellatus]|uniref:Dihydrodipicolinate synthase family protein n=1 Tax=Methyloraptor flagellatus TaxID=3162530 RepID=A0AAU7XA06_9HYPH